MQKMKHLCHFVYIDDSFEKKISVLPFPVIQTLALSSLSFLFGLSPLKMCENKRLNKKGTLRKFSMVYFNSVDAFWTLL